MPLSKNAHRFGKAASAVSERLDIAKGAAARAGAARALKEVRDQPRRIFADLIEAHAQDKPDKIAVICGEACLSYAAFDGMINRFARWALAQGIKPGDRVAIMMENSAGYLAAWNGFNRIGAIGVLINTNLTGAALKHAMDVAGAKHLIASPAYARQPQGDRTLWVWGQFDDLFLSYEAGPLPTALRRRGDIDEVALYIYTSGTTGWPKAARMTHRRVLTMGIGIVGAVAATADDRVLCVLPMYHGSGGICAPVLALAPGGMLVIEKRFSATKFWDLVAEHDITLIEYVGEICRYLMNAPAHPRERGHHIRAFCGAGLRPDIWQAFQDRFDIPWVLEFFGSTEGNVSMSNMEGKIGACGYLPKLTKNTGSIRLIRHDPDSGEVLRDEAGRGVACGIGDIGEAVGLIGHASDNAGRRFEGYSDPKATETKVLRDLFVDGDAWFRTGDLFRFDEAGFIFFVDRSGDTYRWKSENVSTAEVADTLAGIAGILEASVYGVGVPGHEGRAGMATLVVDDDFTLSGVSRAVVQALPSYARPVFLRLVTEIDVTGTFKQSKVKMIEEGYDLNRVTDPLFVWDREHGGYVSLTAQLSDGLQQSL